MPDYDTTSGPRGLSAAFDAIAKRQEAERDRAREFKALQEYAEVAHGVSKDVSTPLNLDSLKGLVRGKEAQSIRLDAERRANLDMSRHLLESEREARIAASQAAMPGFAQSLARYAAGYQPGTGSAPLRSMQPLEAYAAALQDNPDAARGVNPADLSRMLLDDSNGDLTTGTFTHPITGAAFVVRGRQILPAGWEQGADPDQGPEIPGYFTVRTSRGGVQYIKKPEPKTEPAPKPPAALESAYYKALAAESEALAKYRARPSDDSLRQAFDAASAHRKKLEKERDSFRAPAPTAPAQTGAKKFRFNPQTNDLEEVR